MDTRVCFLLTDNNEWMDIDLLVSVGFLQEKEVVVFLQTFFEDLFASIRSFVEPKAIASVFLWNIRL